MGYLTHLTLLDQTIREHPNNVAFKVPGKDGLRWRDISYQLFWDDVTQIAVRWLDKLKPKTGSREIIGLWTAGKTYVDVIHLFGLQRAGYVPHLVSTSLEDLNLVRNLFEQSGAKIIVCDLEEAKEWKQLAGQFEIIPLLNLEEICESLATSEDLPPFDGDGDDILSIDQSSGSSSGRPKLVHFTRRWMDANTQKCQIGESKVSVSIRSDSFCYAPQLLHSLRAFLYADCTVLTSRIIWRPDELANIISECGVTNISLYPSLIRDIIQKARDSPNLTEKLRSLQSLTYGGGPLDEYSIEWAKEMCIPIRARFGCTEVGMIMISQPGTPHLLRFFRKFDYEFVPVPGHDAASKVRELVILPTSPDCPHPALLNPKDGKYYTNDLFERVESSEFGAEEVYISRGRRDDIIIMEEASNCDAKYLESRVGYFCHDLISTFVIVGQGRPSPALLVEPPTESQDSGEGHASLHNLLASRLEPLISSKDGSQLYPHERIKPEYIIVLPKGSLPISPVKGTVIRSKAEEKFKELLDGVYAGDSVYKDV